MLGPLPTGDYLLVVVDYFSRWMEVDEPRSTTSAAIIKYFDSHFPRYGSTTDNNQRLIMGPTLYLRRWISISREWALHTITVRPYDREPMVMSCVRTVQS